MPIADALKSLATQTKADLDAVHEAGIAKGAKSEYDKFWDGYQDYGKRIDYRFGFTGGTVGKAMWNASTFYPKYDIKPVGNTNDCFRYLMITDLEQHLKDCGVELDTSKVTSFGIFFGESRCVVIPTIDITGLDDNSQVTSLFSGCYILETIRKIKTKETLTYSTNLFQRCEKLENIRFEGTIGNDINFQDCPLSAESAYDIVLHLKVCGYGDEQTPPGTYTLYLNEGTWTRLSDYLKSNYFPNLDEDYGGVKNWVSDTYGWNCA